MSKKNLPDNINVKSEEVQAIIDRMPTKWSKWIALCVIMLISIIICISFFIKYPDTVDGQITITGGVAPIRLIANNNGRIQLLQPNNTILQPGDVISYIESGANYKHILLLDSLLNNWSVVKKTEFPFPDTLLLGGISSAYNRFLLTYLQYERLLTSDIYVTMRLNLEQQIVFDEAVIENMDKELVLKNTILYNAQEQLDKDSILLTIKGISEQEYKQQYASYISMQEAQLALQSSQLLKYSTISQNKLEIQRISLEEIENKDNIYSELMTNSNELKNTINMWKEQYLQYTPVAGELEYLGFWRDNSFVQSGVELFSIIPDKINIIGEVIIPSLGAGKVKIGQTANVKINNYPYDEYGLLKGVVTSISRITNKVQTIEGIVSDGYLVIISFPNGTATNYGIELKLDFETKGTVEIITRPKQLIERLFDNLKSEIEK